MEKPLVLIVEDDPVQSQIFRIALKNDFDVETLMDGDSAASRLRDVIPALVILDLNLPGITGPELISRIRADDRIAHIRIILATADAQQADRLHNDADLVLLKPISPGQLNALSLRLLMKPVMPPPASSPETGKMETTGTEMKWLEVSMTVNADLVGAVTDVLVRYAPGGITTEQAVVKTDAQGIPVHQITVRAYMAFDDMLEETRRDLEQALFDLGRIEHLPAVRFTPVADRNGIRLP